MAEYVNRWDVNNACYNIFEEVVREHKAMSAMEVRKTMLRFEKAIISTPAADVVPIREGENISDLHPVDEFVCSVCGIVLEGWSRVVTDEDDGEQYFYEYEFKFCPNCGANMKGGKE